MYKDVNGLLSSGGICFNASQSSEEYTYLLIMLFERLLPLLLAAVLSEALAVTPHDVVLVRRGKDSETIAYYSNTGNCFGYFGKGNNALSFAPCKIWCPKKFPGSNPEQVGVSYTYLSPHANIEYVCCPLTNWMQTSAKDLG